MVGIVSRDFMKYCRKNISNKLEKYVYTECSNEARPERMRLFVIYNVFIFIEHFESLIDGRMSGKNAARSMVMRYH